MLSVPSVPTPVPSCQYHQYQYKYHQYQLQYIRNKGQFKSQRSEVRCQMFLVTLRLALWILKYLLSMQNTFQIFIKCVNFKKFTNVLQIFFKCLANFSFFVSNRDKLIQSLAVFWLINISIAINHYFSGASAATQKVSVISKSSRYIWSLHILTDPTRSLHIPSDLSRS